MPTRIAMIEGQRIEHHRPWSRVVTNENGWRMAIDALAAGDWTLLGLWGDADTVHMAVRDDGAGEIAVLSLPCPPGSFPSVGARHPPARRLERAIGSLFGLQATGSPDALIIETALREEPHPS